MKALATFMLMVSLLAMGVATASADITRPPCSAQIRADDMCHAPGLPGSNAETVKKPGMCLLCLVETESLGEPVLAGFPVHAAFGVTVVVDSRWAIPWRPPRA